MECILWDEYQIASAHFLYFVAYLKINITFDDDKYLVVVFLSVQGIPAVTNDSNICGQMLSLNNEDSFDWIVPCRFICFEQLDNLLKVLKVCHFGFLPSSRLGRLTF